MDRIRLLGLASCFILATITPQSSEEAQFNWRLYDVVFDGGGTATGYFVYDDETGTVTDWLIQVKGGNAGFPPFTYTPTNSRVPSVTDQYVRFTDTNTGRVLQILTTKSLRTEDGHVPLSFHSSEILSEALRSLAGGSLRRGPRTSEESLHQCQGTISREIKHFLSQRMNALRTCLQTLSREVIRDNSPNAAANPAPVCVAAFRKLSDSRGVGESLEEHLLVAIKAQCDPASPTVIHTLADLLGNGAEVAESPQALNLNAFCTDFGGDGVIDSLDEWITCMVAASAWATNTAIAAIYPRALEWLNLIWPALAALKPPEDDPNQIADALAGLDAVRAALNGQATATCGNGIAEPGKECD